MGLLNQEAGNIKPLNDTRSVSLSSCLIRFMRRANHRQWHLTRDNDNRAIQNGATTLAETFLFFVGAGLIVGESVRSSRKDTRRRDQVQDRLETLEEEVKRLSEQLEKDNQNGVKGIDGIRER